MNEKTPINPENKRPLTPEELAEMKKLVAQAEAQQAADAFLTVQEKAPQKPESFQVHPDSAHVEKVDQMIGQHNEAGIPLPDSIPVQERAPVLGKLLQFKTKAERIAKAEEIRVSTDISPFQQAQGMAELLESDKLAEDVEKAA